MIRNGYTLAFIAITVSGLASAADNDRDRQTTPSVALPPPNPAIQFSGFLDLGLQLQELRESRRIPVAEFLRLSKEPDTIILDTRSRDAFDDVHIANAVHLNFSDFTEAKLRKTIPSKQTRILIYCNNNFVADGDTPDGAHTDANAMTEGDRSGVVQGLTDKRPALALNIPTFINLNGYGYKNVYELADRLPVSDKRIPLVGRTVGANIE